MKEFLHLDFETRSTQILGDKDSVGLDNYWRHESTQILMLAYAFGNGPVELWQPRFGSIPDRLHRALVEVGHPLAAWNSGFERKGLETKLAIVTPIDRWHDPQASARYLSMPGALDKVGPILGLPTELQKDERGEALIDLFSKPHFTKKKKGVEPVMYFNDWNSHPVEWEEFCEYCRQDVVAEREIMHREIQLGAFPLPELERKIWVFDQQVNDRGIPVSVKFARSAYKLATRDKEEAIKKQNELTGLQNANSNTQLLAWAKTQGYEPNTLNKNTVDAELKYRRDILTPLCAEVLEARRAASSTTYKKLSAILRLVSSDGRLRNQFLYMGSARCGRWSGTGVQLHNLSRSGMVGSYNFEDEKVLDEARQMVYNEDYDGIKAKFGSVLLVIKNLIRTTFSCEDYESRFEDSPEIAEGV